MIGTMIETWKPVFGHERDYEVSSLGRIRRLSPASGTSPGRLLKPRLRKNGRHAVILYRNQRGTSYLLHRVVTAAFLGECPVGHEVNHIDGNPTNNTLVNLEYVTPSENQKHAYRVLGRKPPMAKLGEADVRIILERRRTGEVQQRIAEDLDIPQSLVSQVCSGKRYAWLAPEVSRMKPTRRSKQTR